MPSTPAFHRFSTTAILFFGKKSNRLSFKSPIVSSFNQLRVSRQGYIHGRLKAHCTLNWSDIGEPSWDRAHLLPASIRDVVSPCLTHEARFRVEFVHQRRRLERAAPLRAERHILHLPLSKSSDRILRSWAVDNDAIGCRALQGELCGPT